MRLASFANGLAAAGVASLILGCAPGDGEVGGPLPSGSAGSDGTGLGGSGPGGTIGSGGTNAGDAGSGPGGSIAPGGTTGGSISPAGSGGQGNVGGQGNAGGSGGSGGSGVAGNAAGRGGAGGAAGRGGATGGATAGRGGTGGTGGATGRGGTTGAGGGLGGGGGGLQFVGNITTSNAVDTDGRVFATYWNQITPENAGKWGSVQPSIGGAFNWRTLDAIYDYTVQHNIIFKEHNFIWGNQQPGNSGSATEANVRSWMTEFCTRYPNTRLIDVVNEPPPHTTPAYANAIGGGTNGSWQWIINAFKWAREACPNAILLLNDYNNIEWSGDNTRFLGIVSTIKAGGAPIDAIGAQAHDLDYGGNITPVTVSNLLRKLATDSALPIYITEMDISTTDDNQQLQMYQQYFPLFRDSGYVRGITIWGWIYGRTWAPAPNSGLIRNGSPRPAMTWLMQQLGRPAP
jgi:endo-1,4-beta-xylanase